MARSWLPWTARRESGPVEGGARIPGALTPREEDTQIDIAAALTFALYAMEPRLGVGRHCARVARGVRQLAEQLGLEGDDLRSLVRAAQLHEIGLVAIPMELLETPASLTERELRRVRAHSWIGAEIVRRTETDLTAWLVRHQYTDHEALRARFPDNHREVLLAGLLRVADVADALAEPRPYQQPFPPQRREEVLSTGMGTRFHPEAVQAALRIGAEAA